MVSWVLLQHGSHKDRTEKDVKQESLVEHHTKEEGEVDERRM
jgi:hypothetical protein